jgi:hypothetical protein
MEPKCKVCSNKTSLLFEAHVLNTYHVKYYKCVECLFIQTEDPYWLVDAYVAPISVLDVGLLDRNIYLSGVIARLLINCFDRQGPYLDYGGGYGTFVRLMRDKGFNFFLFDKYSENLFAKYFTLNDSGFNEFIALTAFEVFEHLSEPMNEITAMLKYSDAIIFSTELQPKDDICKVDDWWYFVPEGGQHVSLYHLKSLHKIRDQLGCFLYTNGTNLHILTKRKLEIDPFLGKEKVNIFLRYFMKIISLFVRNKSVKSQYRSLLQEDFEYSKSKLAK